MIFYSLQGLGNSVINFPILASLRRRHPVRVVAFENGSAAFFRAHHDDVVGLKRNADLLRFAWRAKAGEVFTCAPTWRREIAASVLSRAERKRWLRPHAGWTKIFRSGPRVAPGVHDLENNLDLLAEGGQTEVHLGRLLDLAPPTGLPRVLGVHPTASTRLKYYPRAFWIELLARLAPGFDEVQVFCGGAAGEVEFCRDLHPRARLAAGLGFGELLPRLNQLAQFIGSDSALMHMAAMLGRPTLGLWAYADYRRIYPYGDEARLLVPRETIAATSFAAPDARPTYLDRLNVATVERVLCGAEPIKTKLARRFGSIVPVYEF